MFVQMLVLGLAMMAMEPVFAETSAAIEPRPIKMVVLGDSLSAGFGLAGPDAFPAKLQKALKANGIAVDMINAGVSGDTSSGGRDRLDWSVPQGTQAVIVELGANDALRGTDPAVTRAALTDIVTRLNSEMNKILAQKDMLDYFDTVGAQVYSTTPDGLRAYVDEDTKRWAEIVEIGHIEKKTNQ